MRRLVVIISSAIILFSAGAFAAEVRGSVTGIGQSAVEGAVVLHRASGARAVTDARGEFVLQVPDADRVRLEIVHPDYYEREFQLTRKSLGEKVAFTLVPLIRQNEEVVVTALRYPEPSIKVPAAGTVVQGEALTEKMVPNITEAIQDVPGVAALGSGGFSLVPSVRGLARRRVLYLVDGARVESDRRTGPNASFVNPEDLDRIEVLRSPSSVFYGSDAIGGVIHLMTRVPSFRRGLHGRLSAGTSTVNGEFRGGLALEGAGKTTAFSLSVQSVDAGNYSAPGGVEVLQSQYTQRSLLAKVAHRTERREIEIGFLGSRGMNIGKPNTTAATKPTWYPREDQNLLQLHWKEKNVGRGGEVLFHAFVNPNFLETRTDTYNPYRTKESFARTESTEFGAQLSFAKKLGSSLRMETGVDYFGRGGANASNRYTLFDESGAVTEETEELPYVGGRRHDVGFFLSADYFGVRNLDVLVGARYDFLRMEATPLGETESVKTRDARGSGFAAVSYKLRKDVTAFVNVSRAYRLPSINERFYTGISGRGFIIGQPGLVPETSLNFDGGLKFLGRRFFAGAYGFTYGIDDMIERYLVDPETSTYTYGNIERGRIRGFELEAEYFPLPGWKLFGNLFAIRGRSPASGAFLNDVPPFQFFAGTRVWKGRFSAEANATIRLKKANPGPAEVPVDGSELVNLKAGYLWRGLTVYATLANVFDATYIARPDAEAMIEPRRNLRLSIAYSF